MASGSSAAGGLPAAIGAPHIYHLGADTFFLDRASAIGLTSEQQMRLSALRENAALTYATTQRKIDQGEQDLWVLSSSEAPEIAKIEGVQRELRIRIASEEDADNAIGLRERKRPQEHALNHAEYRAVRADGEPERKYDGDGESGSVA